MVIDKMILDELTEKAKVKSRLRIAMDLRNSQEDKSQRMRNALEPGTVIPIHRHKGSSETVVIVRGRIRWLFFDDDGKETESILLDEDGEVRMLMAEKGRWHSLECLESSVIFEAKDGAYHPLEEDEIFEVAKK